MAPYSLRLVQDCLGYANCIPSKGLVYPQRDCPCSLRGHHVLTLGQKLNIGHMAGIGLKLRILVVKSMLISDMIFLKSLNGLILIYGHIKFFLGVSLGILFSYTRSLRHFAPLLLAPAEDWRALGPLRGPSAHSSVAESTKQNILNLV